MVTLLHKQIQLTVLLSIGLLLVAFYSKQSGYHTKNRPRGRTRILRIQPTWTTDLQTTEKATNAYPFSPLLDIAQGGESRIVLRVFYERARHLQGGAVTYTEPEDEDEELAVNVSFEDVFKTVVFISTTWLLGTASVRAGLPSLVGEIASGCLLGPPLADWVPFPEAMVLIGSFGLIGLILESGVDIDIVQLKETGSRAVIMAFAGTAMPLVVGLGLSLAAGEDMKSAISIGACFAPSSLGVVANVLQSGEILNTPVGQMIVASSVVDDILGLILLGILEVFVKENPVPFDFVLPFLSSFGYLIVLGYSGISWLPHLIEKKILSSFPRKLRDLAALSTMFLLLIIYMPILNYSGASYLTGAFLAGLPFSQIYVVRSSFKRNTGQVLKWLVRVFFAATIGFQVPITKFNDPYVLTWGFKFIIPVLAKLPLGAFRPRSRHKLPDDFPYDPHKRDLLITSLSVLCRGEFNFIIASFSLAEGLIGPELYSAVVFAVLLSSIFGPLLLARVIKHYNNLSKAYIEGNHPIERIGDTCDGTRPLFLAIQARTPVQWSLQDTFKTALEKDGLIIIDHRSWHTIGVDSVDITELFALDTKVKVKVAACFSPLTTRKDSDYTVASGESVSSGSIEDKVGERQEIKDRTDSVREILVQCLKSDSPGDYKIQVSQWEAFVFDEANQGGDVSDVRDKNPILDVESFAGHGGYNVMGGFTADHPGKDSGHHRASSAFSLVLPEAAKEIETDMLKPKLHGYVRQNSAGLRSSDENISGNTHLESDKR